MNECGTPGAISNILNLSDSSMELALENSFLQVPFDQVAERVANGGLMLDGIISLFQVHLWGADFACPYLTHDVGEIGLS